MLNLFKSPFQKVEMIEKLELYSLLGILFFIPISPAAPSLLGVLLIVLFFLKGQFSASWLKLKEQPVFWAFLFYLLLYPLSMLWSDNTDWAIHMSERHMIYLMFPFVLLIVKKEHFILYFAAFILGVTFAETVSYLLFFDLIDGTGIAAHPGEPTPFYHHVEYNPILAWALYLMMFGLLFRKQSKWLKVLLTFFIVTMTINMFITGGRGGQLTYFIIAGLLFLQFFDMKKQLWKGFVFGTGFVAMIFITAYQSSSLFETRFNAAVEEIVNYHPQADGSVSHRFHMYINTAKMSFDRPFGEILLGSGVGDFPQAYSKFVGEEAPLKLVANKQGHSHPHNMYLYQLGALGLVGLFSLLWLFWVGIKAAMTFQDEFTYHRWAFLVFLAVIQITDSLLLAHPISILFIVFSAILFFDFRGQNAQQAREVSATES